MRRCFKRAFARALWNACLNCVIPYRRDFVESIEVLRKAWLMWEREGCYMEVSGEKTRPRVAVCVTVENVLLCIGVDLVKEKINVSATNGYIVIKNESFDVVGVDLDALLNACRFL